MGWAVSVRVYLKKEELNEASRSVLLPFDIIIKSTSENVASDASRIWSLCSTVAAAKLIIVAVDTKRPQNHEQRGLQLLDRAQAFWFRRCPLQLLPR